MIKQVASGRFGVTAEYLDQLPGTADQDRPGCQARRGRPVAGPQSKPRNRPRAAFHAGCDPDFAAAASRHLFDRGHRPADLRSEECQSRRRVSVKLVSEAGVGTVAAGVAKGACRHDSDQRLRRRHRRLAAFLDQARGMPWELGPGRNPADAGAQRAAQPGAAANRRPDAHRPRCVVAALLGAEEFGFATRHAGGLRLCIMMRKCHNEHLPGRCGHTGSGTA
jgi:glutamate synthase (NADPH) large chain